MATNRNFESTKIATLKVNWKKDLHSSKNSRVDQDREIQMGLWAYVRGSWVNFKEQRGDISTFDL